MNETTENERLREALRRAADRFGDAASVVERNYSDINAAYFLRSSAERCRAAIEGNYFDDPLGKWRRRGLQEQPDA